MRKNSHYTPVLLNLEDEDLRRVDNAANELDINRTQFLRQSVVRNLRHFENNELPVIRRYKLFHDTFDNLPEVMSNVA
jgi:hypothetical protein